MMNAYFSEESNIISVHLVSDASVNAWHGTVILPETSAIARLMTDDARGFMWQTIPHIVEGRGIEFAGGLPEGFTGDVVVFRFALNAAPSSLSFSPDTTAYLNDGRGTEIPAQGSVFVPHVVLGAPRFPQDTTPPEPFTPELSRNSLFFDGRTVVLFGTRDLGSGVHGYAVREVTTHGMSAWHPAQSPYLIANDVTALEIRAYDNAGNVREEMLTVASSRIPTLSYLALFGAILLCVLVYNTFRQWRRS